MMSFSSTGECLVVSEDRTGWTGLHTHLWAMAKLCTKIKLPHRVRKISAFCQSSLYLHKANDTLNSKNQVLVCLNIHQWFFVRLLLNSVRNHKTRFHSWYSHMIESFLSRLVLLTNRNPKLFIPKADGKLPLLQETSGLPGGTCYWTMPIPTTQLKSFRNQM